ncbi:MAG: flagellar basal body rod protein FlgC [Spirochaetaceae bacterium]|jgi:flagellar basal-body rod protein FlgC|nr:flagellar basal body rod protein FlgC [Spirochaetaceae bacterium]
MGIFSSINIAATGLTVERLRSDVIADNIANAQTTRTQEGGAFRRKRVILSTADPKPIFRNPFVPQDLDNGPGHGVRVMEIVKDDAPGRLVWDPTHPDAVQSGPQEGYVEYPNVSIVNEMTDLIAANRAYEANSAVIQGARDMFSSALEIGR